MKRMMTVGMLEYLLSIVDDDCTIDYDALIDNLNLWDERPEPIAAKSYSYVEMAEKEAKQGFYRLPDSWEIMSDTEKEAFYLSTLADDFESEGLLNLSSSLAEQWDIGKRESPQAPKLMHSSGASQRPTLS